MPVSEAQKRATMKYDVLAYDKILIRVPKGKADEIREHATLNGESLNGYITRLIKEDMKTDFSSGADFENEEND